MKAPAHRPNYKLRMGGGLFLLAAIAAQVFLSTPAKEGAAHLWRRWVLGPRVPTITTDILPQGQITMGLYRPELPLTYDGFYRWQDSTGLPARIVSWYQAWGDGEEHQFREKVVRNVGRHGLIPMITWEPWLSAFKRNNGIEPPAAMASLAAGEYDRYIRSWARGVMETRVPILVRFGHEMSNPWYSWSPEYGNKAEDFIAAWKRVRSIFREEGAHNAAFVWTPYLPGDTIYWPGDAEVDWIGLDIFNYGTVSEGGHWTDFTTATRFLYDPFRHLGKPMLLAEFSTSDYGGDRAQWWREALQSLRRGEFPLLRGAVIFDTPKGVSSTGIPIDWSFDGDPETFQQIRNALREENQP